MKFFKTIPSPLLILKTLIVCLIMGLFFVYCSDDSEVFFTEHYSTPEADAEEDDSDDRRWRPGRRKKRRSSSDEDTGTPDPVQSAPAVAPASGPLQRPQCPPPGRKHLRVQSGDECICPAGKYQFFGIKCCRLCERSGDRITERRGSCDCYTPARCPPPGKPYLTHAFEDQCICPRGVVVYGDRCCDLSECPHPKRIDRNRQGCHCID